MEIIQGVLGVLGKRSQAVFVIGTAAVALAAIGCVSSGSYRDLEAERNQIAKQRDQLEQQVGSLEGSLAESQKEADAMRGTFDQLVTELEQEVKSGQIEIMQLVDGIQMNVSDKLLFPSGSAALNEEGLEVIGRVADQIKNESAIVSVEGHTDSAKIGPSLAKRYPTNWELAGARAAAVVRQLSEKGVPPERLRAVSRGPFAPVATNDDEEGRARNRRTEIILRPLP